MKVVSYLSSLPAKTLRNNSADSHKIRTLVNFANGATAAGDSCSVTTATKYEPADVAVILGWVHDHSKTAPHLQFRKEIIERQLQLGKHTVIVDSNLFLYSDTENIHRYYRYSFDGIFPNTGIYCDSNPTAARWKSIRNKLKIDLKEYRSNGSHILICLQRNGGWSMGNTTVTDWLTDTIKQLRLYTDRPIVLRGHPGDKTIGSYINSLTSLSNNITVSTNSALVSDLKNCWAVVNHNSSPTVGAAIEGYPVFVTDPARSQCYDIANIDLSKIETPVLPDRQQWIQRISMFHWNFQEVSNGTCWKHMRQYI